ncbi:hypothetical protein DEO72_LG7g3064 [Vigna unguiculata]|uniref:Bifunctional inhibitor/plant lipid transfer protein/seed storage helical domain-containing protein n=1 Tax=Vigna unguiculata TaxID=3917 RepID=A0A4D6MLW0_VIGUN|nr:hypothetical protein DEO72_LG7g3064 [Vigna unguiculata]
MVMLTWKMGKREFSDATMLMVCGIVAMVMVPLISAQFECGNVFAIYWECDQYIQRSGPMVPPSGACCRALDGSNVTCLCQYFAEYESRYSTEKVVYVLSECGMPLASGTKCGKF